jgi:hypothetical protein
VYKVVAFNAAGDSVPSNEAIVYVNQLIGLLRDQVTITSTPPLNATVDSLYTYQVTAVSDSPNAVLHYGIGPQVAVVGASLITIDSTGLIKWTPKVRGLASVEVIVTSSLGGEARQEFVIRVAGIDGKVAGIVTDTLGNPLSHVVVHLYGMGVFPFMRIEPVPFGLFDYIAETDSTGHYTITNVDEGKYRIRATPLNENYLPAWYDSAITVTDTATHIVGFKLENRFHLLPGYTISGAVTDSTGAAVKGAWVVFARAGFVFNEAREDADQWSNDVNFREFFIDAIHDRGIDHHFGLDDRNSPYVSVVYVDSLGAYTDTLPEGHYVVFARAKGYYRTFFSNDSNMLSADILTLSSDTSGINFTLYQIPPVVLGEISGSVLDSTSGAGVPSRIIAFRDVWGSPDTLKVHVAGAYFSDADSTGVYSLDSLPPGNYKILALPLGGYAPSFYSLSGSTVKWSAATAVSVDGNSTSGINIFVLPLPDSVSGYVSINGTVKNSSTKGGVGGAFVYAADADGHILGYGVTDRTGKYTVAGLAPGTYNTFADAIGFTSTGSQSSNPSYDASGNAVAATTDLTVTPETAVAVKSTTVRPTSYALEQNYPNPFNPTTQIAFEIAKSERVNVSIFNILGQKIATIVDGEMSSGSHVVTWSGRNDHGELSPSGVYFYRLSTPDFTAVRKMLLLK